MRKRSVVIVGGGIGGLVAASQLAYAGFEVTIYEQGPQVGGKCNTTVFDGCTFETGPTLVTMPFVLDSVFERVGRRREDYLTLQRVDPACQYRWSDGSTLDMPFDLDAVIDAIEDFAPGEGANAKAYLDHARDVYEMTKDIFIFSAFDGFLEFAKPGNLKLLPKLPRLRFMSTLHDHNARYFRDPRLLQLFDRFATYNGSNPYKAPATLMVIPWVEIGYGAWYPTGGMYSIVKSLEQLSRDLGVTIHTNARVQAIILDRKTAVGITLASGDNIACDHVISNADVYVTKKHLLKMPVSEPKDLSCSGLVVQASVSSKHDDLRQHNILFADVYEREFDAIENGQRHAVGSTIYISRSVVADPNLAADNCENWFMLINAPANGVSPLLNDNEPSQWNDHYQIYVDEIVERLNLFGLKPSISAVNVRTPDTMATEWSSYRGALYGASSNSSMSAFLRPRQKSRDIANLWYVGGSAHPGGGIPLVATSGIIAAELIVRS